MLKAIRENEPRAISLGYKTDRYKLLAFVLSAPLAGLAGATKALVLQLASLTDVHWSMSGEVVLMTLLGGLGTVFGPVVGAFVIVAMENYLRRVRRVGAGDPGRDLRHLRAGVPPRHRRRNRALFSPFARGQAGPAAAADRYRAVIHKALSRQENAGQTTLFADRSIYDRYVTSRPPPPPVLVPGGGTGALLRLDPAS